MKLSTVFVGALATLAAAAPAKVEEEKRNIAGFGGGFDAFGLGGAAAFGNLAFFGGGGIAQGSIFNNALLSSVNNFNIVNPQVAFLLGANNFDFNSLFTFFDLSLAVNPFANIFNLGAGNFIDVQTILQINTALTLGWMLKEFGNELFFQQAFLGFRGLQVPTLNFDILANAGLGLQSQFIIQQDLLDINAFNSIGAGFLGGAGINALNGFDFINLKNQGLFFKE